MSHTWKEIGLTTGQWDNVTIWKCDFCGASQDNMVDPGADAIVLSHMVWTGPDNVHCRPWSPAVKEFKKLYPQGATCTQTMLWRHDFVGRVWMPLAECLDRNLYRIKARNIAIGVFNLKDKSFVGLRTKFDSTFLDREFHWDTGTPFGTAKPIEDLHTKLPDAFNLELGEADRGLRTWIEEQTEINK